MACFIKFLRSVVVHSLLLLRRVVFVGVYIILNENRKILLFLFSPADSY